MCKRRKETRRDEIGSNRREKAYKKRETERLLAFYDLFVVSFFWVYFNILFGVVMTAFVVKSSFLIPRPLGGRDKLLVLIFWITFVDNSLTSSLNSQT